MANYFAVEPLLVARLESQLGTSARVFSAPDLPSVFTAGDPLPSVYVIHGQDVITPSVSFEADDEICDQAWVVAAVVRHERTGSGADARAAGGTLVDACLTALRGYQLSSAVGPCRRVTAPRDAYDGAGLMVYPLQFLIHFY